MNAKTARFARKGGTFWWFSTNVIKEEERNWKNSKEGAREETTKMDVPFVSLQRL